MLLFAPRAMGMMVCVAGLSIVGTLGCGFDQYETRLKQSQNYYNYLDRIEQNLGPRWSDGRIVEQFRAPKQFVPIAAPVPFKNEDGQDEMPAVDLRQPDYLNLLFPAASLVGAWEAQFAVSTTEGSADTRKGYIYILSNYWGFLGEDPAEALKFTPATLQLVGDALDDHIKPEDLERPATEAHPKKGGYLPEGIYNAFEFHPKAITLAAGSGSTINYTFKAYGKQNGNIQAIILVVLPENISAQEKLFDLRIPMMLEQFRITKTEPKPGNQGGAPVQGNNNVF